MVFTGIDRLDLAASCACGQCFRWHPCPAGSGPDGAWQGVVRGRAVTARPGEDSLYVYPAPPEDAALWADYFDLGRAYEAIERQISGLKKKLESKGGREMELELTL